MTFRASEPMNDIIVWHSVNAGNDTRPVLWRLEGMQIVAFVASVAAAIVLFQLLGGNRGLGLLPSLGVAALVPVGTVFILIRFFVGRPPSYFWDFLAWEVPRCLGARGPLISQPEQVDR